MIAVPEYLLPVIYSAEYSILIDACVQFFPYICDTLLANVVV